MPSLLGVRCIRLALSSLGGGGGSSPAMSGRMMRGRPSVPGSGGSPGGPGVPFGVIAPTGPGVNAPAGPGVPCAGGANPGGMPGPGVDPGGTAGEKPVGLLGAMCCCTMTGSVHALSGYFLSSVAALVRTSKSWFELSS